MGKVAAFFLGMLTGVVVLAGGGAIALAVIPTGTYLNAFSKDPLVGDNIAKKGLFSAIQDINTYTIDDVPAIKTALDRIFTPEGMGKYVSLDYEALRTVKLTDPQIGEKLSAAIKVTATIQSLGVNLGNFGNLDMFKSYRAYNPTPEEITANPAVFYYEVSAGQYARAYNDDGTKVAGYTSGQLYLPNLSQVVVTEIFQGLSFQIQDLTFGDLATKFLGNSEASLANNTIYKLVKDTKLKDLAKIDSSTFKLVDVVAKTATNADLYNLLEDLTGLPAEQITLGNLSNLNVSNAKLTSLLPETDNEKLYAVLKDMTGQSSASTITVGMLKTADINNVKLSSILENAGDNAILSALLSKETPVTVGGLGAAINDLSLYEVYGDTVFTTTYADRANDDKYALDSNTGVLTYDTSLPVSGDSTFYVSKKAGVWLLLSYTVQDEDIDPANGRAKVFRPSSASLSSLQSDSGSIASSIGEARIYQLITAGVLEDGGYPDSVKAKTLSEAISLIP